ncbi:MAG: HAD-IA family hydrolase [Opitutaceae bacterium]|nr:HAD-IA family hydrolase [Opitutaceae bacterium]
MIRALVFDFDGLILDTETPLIDAYADVHAAHGVAFDRELFIHGVGHADFAFDPWSGFSGGSDRSELEREMRSCKQIRILAEPILPGVVSMMDLARERGLSVALASNSPHLHCDAHLRRIGLLDRFHFIGCREDVAFPKPEPDLYRLAVERLGLRPDEAIAFEDSHAGSLAAKRAGLWCVAIPNPSSTHHDFSHADLRVGSMAELMLDTLISRFIR